MSLTIVVIDKTCESMIIISDKRASNFKGRHIWFGNDDFIKHHIINEKVCFHPGSFILADNKPARRLALLLQFSNQSTAKLIDIVAQMDRQYTNVEGQIIHDPATLCGLTDDNKFFIMSCQPDDSLTFSKEEFGKYTLTIQTNGEHLQRPAGEYLAFRINKKGDTLLEALKRTVKFVSTIEKTVSPTYIYTVINKEKQWQQLAASQPGK